MTAPPIPFIWLPGNAMRGCCFVPAAGWHERAEAAYKDNQHVTLAPVESRSKPSHDQQFAYIDELWRTLPEHIAPQFPTADHLRKHALIMTGWAIVCKKSFTTPRDAVNAAALLTMKPDADYELVTVDDKIVTHAVAKSQSYRAMGKADFQRSKDDVIKWIEDLIGVERAA